MSYAHIDDKKISFEQGITILEAAVLNGIMIPNLCYLQDTEDITSCRLCVVEVHDRKNLMPSCSTLITEDMVIYTESERVVAARKDLLGLFLANHPHDCLTCEKAGDCRLQDYCYEYDVKEPFIEFKKIEYEIDDTNPFYILDKNKCIMCRKCVKMCSELQCSNAIGFSQRGFKAHITAPFEQNLDESICVSCGNCVSVCPVGALKPKSKERYRSWEVNRQKTTCPYCGVGCEMNLLIKQNRIVGVEPVRGPANDGLLCVKGKFAYGFVNHPDRLKKPLIKRNGKFEKATWEEAFDLITSRIIETKQEYGADSLGGFSSARCTNEENYLFQKLFRGCIGTNNVDHCARLCHASTVSGLATTLGSGAMTNSISEIIDSDVIFVTGSNTTETHPVIGSKIKQAKMRGAKVIVAEPRRIELADGADVFLQIKPGTNVALFNGLMNIIIEEGLQDREYIAKRTENYEMLVDIVKRYTPGVVSEICGIDEDQLKIAARLYGSAEKASIFFAMGVTQHTTGTHGVMSVSNLALLCGNVGKESAGVNPLRGQNNVQGACDVGALPGDLPGYQKVFDQNIINKFEKVWNCKLSNKVGLSITEMLNKAEENELKFLYIMGENPMISDPDINHVEEALKKVDFLVVQDIFLTETAIFADVVLPVATFAEKDGTFTNTERRIQRIRKAIEPIGECKADWQILMELINRTGIDTVYSEPAEIMDEIASLSPIYGGISYRRLEDNGLQWPCPTKDHPGTRFLHKGTFSRGKALFKPVEYVESAELTDKEYPYILTTGRILYQYHTRTMTGKIDGLNQIAPGSYVEINPEMASRLGLENGENVSVASRRGEITTKVKVTDIVEDGVIFIPFHFADGAANYLTNTALDPIAKIPELKVCAVRINKIV